MDMIPFRSLESLRLFFDSGVTVCEDRHAFPNDDTNSDNATTTTTATSTSWWNLEQPDCGKTCQAIIGVPRGHPSLLEFARVGTDQARKLLDE
jgi:hypothetical protein